MVFYGLGYLYFFDLCQFENIFRFYNVDKHETSAFANGKTPNICGVLNKRRRKIVHFFLKGAPEFNHIQFREI